jgi:Na+/melibiose symporter-like transporter
MTFTANSILCILMSVCFALGSILNHLSYSVASILFSVIGMTLLLTHLHNITEHLIKLKYELEMEKNNNKVKQALEQLQSSDRTLH